MLPGNRVALHQFVAYRDPLAPNAFDELTQWEPVWRSITIPP